MIAAAASLSRVPCREGAAFRLDREYPPSRGSHELSLTGLPAR